MDNILTLLLVIKIAWILYLLQFVQSDPLRRDYLAYEHFPTVMLLNVIILILEISLMDYFNSILVMLWCYLDYSDYKRITDRYQ